MQLRQHQASYRDIPVETLPPPFLLGRMVQIDATVDLDLLSGYRVTAGHQELHGLSDKLAGVGWIGRLLRPLCH
jgi:hypothetical protein